ncbi:MAG: 4a-hydroxytetrahydrobiopterin dehydratase [Acidobacteria bacterium]|nr:4a-hydroxytetrahydrobiopterin dehydratase [Acidobacteriota bacterium]|tara:strand:+ start:13 stop:300 length:288 start_codon:yes stop_codon:yes gene_type:complete
MARLSAAAITEQLASLSAWIRDGQAIQREFTFPSFLEAVAFANRVAMEAERADHHPDIVIRFRRVMLVYVTHSESGLTQKDFDGARMADRVAEAQ